MIGLSGRMTRQLGFLTRPKDMYLIMSGFNRVDISANLPILHTVIAADIDAQNFRHVNNVAGKILRLVCQRFIHCLR
jgi:hypothetical protein